MNDNHPTNPDHQAGDPTPPAPPSQPGGEDVWGVRPPVLGGQPTDQPGYGQPGYGQPSYGQEPPYGSAAGGQGPGATGPGTGSGIPTNERIDRGLSALQKSPLRRDTQDGIVGGVAAGVARHLGISTGVARIATIVIALFGGGVAYLLAWALLPDDHGNTHVEQALKGGKGQSIVISGLAALGAIGLVAQLLDNLGWLIPIAVSVAVVAYVMNAGKKKGLEG